MNRSVKLLVATLMNVVACAAKAQQPVYSKDVSGIHVDVMARDGGVVVRSQWAGDGAPVVLVGLDANIDIKDQKSYLSYPATVVRVFATGEMVERFLADVRRELAMPDSVVRRSLARPSPTLAANSPSFLQSHRGFGGDTMPAQYSLELRTCRGMGMATYTKRENWIELVEGIQRAATIAAEERRAGPNGSAITRSTPRDIEEVGCPARPYLGNTPLSVNRPTDDFLDAARASAIEIIIDSTGAVRPRSARLVRGDSSLFDAARRGIASWRFMPALDAGRHSVAQRARLLVIDRAPRSAADTAQVFQRARAEGAQIVVVAMAPRLVRERTIVMADGRSSIHAFELGKYSRVIFLHAIGGRADHWRAVAEALEPLTGSLAYDLRGHGRSSRSLSADYSLDAHVADLSTVVDSTMVASVILVAEASTCPIAVEFARRMPRRVSALVLVGPGFENAASDATGRLEGFRDGIYRHEEPNLPALLGAGGGDVTLLAERAANDVQSTPPDALSGSIMSLRGYDVRRKTVDFPGPTYALLANGRPYNPMYIFTIHEWAPADSEARRIHVTTSDQFGAFAPLMKPRALASWLATLLKPLI